MGGSDQGKEKMGDLGSPLLSGPQGLAAQGTSQRLIVLLGVGIKCPKHHSTQGEDNFYILFHLLTQGLRGPG